MGSPAGGRHRPHKAGAGVPGLPLQCNASPRVGIRCPCPERTRTEPGEGVFSQAPAQSTGGEGGSGAVKFVWEISRFKLAAQFPTRNPGASASGAWGSAPPRLQSPTHHNISGSVREIYDTKSGGLREISRSDTYHREFDLAPNPQPAVA